LAGQVTEGKQDLEKALSLSQKFTKESAALQAWLTSHETQLQQKNGSGDMPAEIDAEVAWANVSTGCACVRACVCVLCSFMVCESMHACVFLNEFL